MRGAERILRVLLLAVITAIVLAPLFIWFGILASGSDTPPYIVGESQGYPRLAVGSLLYGVVVSLVGAFIHTILAFGLGYSLARGKFPLREELKILTFLGVMIPVTVIAGPIYWVNQSLGIQGIFPGTFLAMWSVPWLSLAFMYYLARLPKKLETYAGLDGLTPAKIFSELIVPYSYRGLIAIFLLSFLINYHSLFGAAIAVPVGTFLTDSQAAFTHLPKLVQVLRFDSTVMPLDEKLLIVLITQIPTIIVIPFLIIYGVPSVRTIITGKFIYRKGWNIPGV